MREKIAKLMYRELSSRAEHVAYLEKTRAKKKHVKSVTIPSFLRSKEKKRPALRTSFVSVNQGNDRRERNCRKSIIVKCE